MRVLLSTIGSRGDVQPLVALALQLRALGQEVRLCVPPDFRDWIDGLGIPVHADRPRAALDRRNPAHQRAGPTLARAAASDDRKPRSPPSSRRSRRQPKAATSSWRATPCRSPLARWPSRWASPTSSPPTARPPCHRHTTRRPQCCACGTDTGARNGRQSRALGPGCRRWNDTLGRRAQLASGISSAWPRSVTCAATSSPTGPGWPPTRRWRPGPIPRTGRVSDRRLDPAGRASPVPRAGDVPRRRRATRLLRLRQHPRAARPQPDDDPNGPRARTPCDRVPRVGRPVTGGRRTRLPGHRRGQPAGAVPTSRRRRPPRRRGHHHRGRASRRTPGRHPPASTTSTTGHNESSTSASEPRTRPARRPPTR